MSKRNYFIYLNLCIVAVFIVYSSLLYKGVLDMPLNLVLGLMVSIFNLYLIGGLIATLGSHSQPQSFAQRFLVLTTFQLLGIMFTFIAIKVIGPDYFKHFVMQFMAVFLFLMIVQTILLVKLGNFLYKK